METKDELLKSFHEQFAENQNHHQTVFIQFISIVFIVIIGYAIVYTNTSKEAEFMYSIKNADGNIESFAISHLISSYIFAQIILTLLCSLTMNIGYGFRRDQKVIFNIRKHYLEKEGLYDKIFEKKSFNPNNKNIFDFLPEFNSIFVNCIIIIEIALYVSIIIGLSTSEKFDLCSQNFFGISFIALILIIPILWSLNLYRIFHKKYKEVTSTEEIKKKAK